MKAYLTSVVLAFVPLFVAIDPAGCVPIFLGLTGGMTSDRMRRIVNQAAAVSLLIAATFAVAGPLIFRLLGIQMADFQIGGGLLLFGYAVTDILATGRRFRRTDTGIGIVPLATPLLAGPALLATIVLMVSEHGLAPTLTAAALNLLLAWAALRSANWFSARIGREALIGVSKVLMVLLAAIGIMMIRRGVMTLLNG
jgi:multiple antibiotic resistance protein